MPSRDAVQLVIGGTSYQDWYEIDLESDLFVQADAFVVQAAIPPASVRSAFREGEKVDIYVGRDRQMAGVIDDVVLSANRAQSRLSITGRDRASYLLDNDAKAIDVDNHTLKSLMEALIDPAWGIRRVIASNEANRALLFGKDDKSKPTGVEPEEDPGISLARPHSKIDPGRRVASVLDEFCRRLGCAWWMTAEGDLFIGKPNYSQDVAYRLASFAAGSRLARENNVETWNVTRSMADRASEIEVVGIGPPESGNLFEDNEKPPTFRETVTDSDLSGRGIVRKVTITDGDATTQQEARKRAELEMSARKLRGLVIGLTVPGFRQGDRLFAIDTLASVKIEEADIDGIFYVTHRRFVERRGESRTFLTLHEKGVWLP